MQKFFFEKMKIAKIFRKIRMGRKGRKRKGGAFGGDRNKRKKRDTDKGGFRPARDPSTLNKDFIEVLFKAFFCFQ